MVTNEDDLKRLVYIMYLAFLYLILYSKTRDLLKSDSAMVFIPELDLA